jgi:xyloglucan-specific exo-beta-1,4-glucanase
VTSVVFDSTEAGRAYAAVADDGVYISDDSGATWSRTAGGPTRATRLVAAPTGQIWAAHSAGVAALTDGEWVDRTPEGGDRQFGSVSVDPQDPALVVAATAEGLAEVYVSTDSGRTWNPRSWNYDSPTLPWLDTQYPEDGWYRSWVSSLTLDPWHSGRVWSTGWFQVGRTDNIRATSPTWKPLVRDLENVVTLDVVEVAGVLLSGHADMATFRHGDGLDSYPSDKMGVLTGQEAAWNYAAQFGQSRQSSSRVFQVGFYFDGASAATNGLARSEDGGKSWTLVEQWPTDGTVGRPTRLAVSGADDRNMVVSREGKPAQYTADGGQTWTDVQGLPDGAPLYSWGHPLAADTETAGAFAYYDDATGTVYRSVDGGKSFQPGATGLVNDPSNNIHGNLKAVPGTPGELWLSLDGGGLLRSTDGGVTFSKVEDIDQARVFGFGKGPRDADHPAIYVYGEVAGRDGIWHSADNGQSWDRLGRPRQITAGADPMVMEGSSSQRGLAFVGTSGRGVFAVRTK